MNSSITSKQTTHHTYTYTYNVGRAAGKAATYGRVKKSHTQSKLVRTFCCCVSRLVCSPAVTVRSARRSSARSGSGNSHSGLERQGVRHTVTAELQPYIIAHSSTKSREKKTEFTANLSQHVQTGRLDTVLKMCSVPKPVAKNPNRVTRTHQLARVITSLYLQPPNPIELHIKSLGLDRRYDRGAPFYFMESCSPESHPAPPRKKKRF